MKTNKYLVNIIVVLGAVFSGVSCANKEALYEDGTPFISVLHCGTANLPTPDPVAGSAYSGTIAINYNVSNGLEYPTGAPIASTGVTGMTATLAAGTLNPTLGTIYYHVSGTPSTFGTVTFPISFYGRSCNISLTAHVPPGTPPSITGLTCGGGDITPPAAQVGIAYMGNANIPYTGSNGAVYSSGPSVASTGVTGLTATLQAGTLAIGSGNLPYKITGTPSASGVAVFSVSFGGFTCPISLIVN